MHRTRTSMAACLIGMACLIFPSPSVAGNNNEIKALKEQLHQTQIMLETMQKRLLRLEQKQSKQQQEQTKTQAAVAAQTEAVAEAATAPSATAGGTSSPNAFNPEISAVLNGKYQAFSQPPNLFSIPGFPLGDAAGLDDRGFSLAESEVDINSNIDNLFYGSLTISLAPQGGASVEEAYLQTLGAPFGLTLKAGRFFSGIGYLNQFHTHHDDFIDRPLPYRALLNTQFGDDGVQLKWLAPTDTFVELGGEIMRGDAFPAGGAAFRGAGTWSAFAHIGGDAGISNSWKGGVSWLQSRSIARNSFDNNGNTVDVFSGNSKLALADFVWKWVPNGNPVNENFRFQSEAFYRIEHGLFGATSPTSPYDGRQFGWYAEGVYQFMPRWDLGYRHSELYARNSGAAMTLNNSPLNDLGLNPRRDSVVLGFANSEFSRIRLQLSRDASQPKLDYQLSMQYLMLLGAHGAHQF